MRHAVNSKYSYKYKRIHKLGQGNFADVLLVEDLTTNQLKALKRININLHDDYNSILNEVKLLQTIKHAHIVECYNYFKEFSRLFIEMEYCEEGDLYRKILYNKEKNLKFSENTILDWISQSAMAIDYLHENRILHRDIKPQNIFLKKNGQVKIGDLGIAKQLDYTKEFTKTALGTPYYLSPEICLGKSYSYPSDMWMLGVVLYELMTLDKPFEGESLHIVLNKIIQEDFQKNKMKEYSPFLQELCQELLEKNPDKRINIKSLLKMPKIEEQCQKINERFAPPPVQIEEKEKFHPLSFEQYLQRKLSQCETSNNNSDNFSPTKTAMNNNPKSENSNGTNGNKINVSVQLNSSNELTQKKIPEIKINLSTLRQANEGKTEFQEKTTYEEMRLKRKQVITKNRSHSTYSAVPEEDLKSKAGIKNITNLTINKNISFEDQYKKNNMDTISKPIQNKINCEDFQITEKSDNNVNKLIKPDNKIPFDRINRRCSDVSKYLSIYNMNKKPFSIENLKKNHKLNENKKFNQEVIKKMFDVNCPFAEKRKDLLKDFVIQKFGNRSFSEIQNSIEKIKDKNDINSDDIYNLIKTNVKKVIGKDNSTFTLILNYLINPKFIELEENICEALFNSLENNGNEVRSRSLHTQEKENKT